MGLWLEAVCNLLIWRKHEEKRQASGQAPDRSKHLHVRVPSPSRLHLMVYSVCAAFFGA
jgi:hypothetical protein